MATILVIIELDITSQSCFISVNDFQGDITQAFVVVGVKMTVSIQSDLSKAFTKRKSQELI